MSGIMHMILGGKGAPAEFLLTISSNQTNLNLRTLAVSSGWDQSSKLKATINSGVYISSNSTGTPALTVSGSFPGGVELVNNGFIYGMGGAGGAGRIYNSAGSGGSGSAGGLALSVSSAITINNTSGTIGGGGGGGGGGGNNSGVAGGGGGGGGISSFAANSSGGSGGGNGSAGGAGTYTAAGGGGAGAFVQLCYCGTKINYYGGNGGTGGSRGASGSAGTTLGGAGGSGGGAVSGNSNITWTATGTRLGSIS